ncbi:MAG: M36 family metallopeptidase [Saprospiraceae bacterium]|nr:M36 family metallopeptidase [Saprospiraceae bacterium]MBP7305612.1 M36 family metallopeptidase [Saprospiraceae bacterium]
MKNIFSRWVVGYFNLFLIVGLSAISVNILNAQSTSKSQIAKELLIPLMKGDEAKIKAIQDMKVSSETFSQKAELTHIYFQQHVGGIPVHNAILNANINKSNDLFSHHNKFVDLPFEKVDPVINPVLTQAEAVAAAAAHFNYTFTGGLTIKENKGGPLREIIFNKGNLSLEDIHVKLMWQPSKDGSLRLAWDLHIYEMTAQNWWSVRVDAITGEVLDQNNWVSQCFFGESEEVCNHKPEEHKQGLKNGNFLPKNIFKDENLSLTPLDGSSYRVYPGPVESPNHVMPFPPADGRTLVAQPADAVASPFGWHDTDGIAGPEFTTTQGNNVHAYTDIDANNTPDAGSSPDGGVGLDFDFPLDLSMAPSTYRPAAVVNLFYWNNYIHDFAYKYGFDELSGNFQVNNYGNGGLGNDDVRAEAQDGSGTNNANFGTPPDGMRPRMQMFIGTNPNPDVDGDFDNAVIAHEYAHGISNRFTGGPANASCLGNAEQMGEGWSDFYGLMMTIKPGDVATTSRGIGTYLFGQAANGPGIRPTRYSTDMGVNPSTYNTIQTAAVPHGVGYVWATMLWDLNWALIDKHGAVAGFDITMDIVNLGMKLQPCNPGFVDGRDAILAADVALNGGANKCLIWEVFARRGLGFSASQGSSGSVADGDEAFDMPPSCDIEALPAVLTVCKPNDAVFTINVGDLNNMAVNLTATGNPAGTLVSFSTNPVNPPLPGVSTMTISNMAVAAPGVYIITISGNDGVDIFETTVTLKVDGSAPGVVTLLTPANGMTDVFNPLLTWSPMITANSYDVQVATDAGFTNVIQNIIGTLATSVQTTGLSSLTTYHWRVRANNSCGAGNYAAFSFTTGDPFKFCVESGVLNTVQNNVPVAIPTGPAVVNSVINVSGAPAYITDINLTTFLTHTFAADLDITLTSPQGTVVTLTTDNGAGTDNVFNGTVWDDSANPGGQVPYTTNNGLATDNVYVNLVPASTLAPEEALAAFIGENPNGNWTLTISDDLAGDGGSVTWTIDVVSINNAPDTDQTSFTQNTPTAIPTGPAVVSSTLNVAGLSPFITDVDVTTFLTHTFAADLDITIMSPSGTVVTLTTDNGAGNDDVFNGTVWDDSANPAGQVPYTTNSGMASDHPYVNLTLASPLAPEEALGAFIGEDPNGTWTITISDDLAGDGGSLDSWSLNISTCDQCTPLVINDPVDQNVCNNGMTTAVNFSGVPASGVTYSWTNNNTSIGLAAAGSGNIGSFMAVNNTNLPKVATITVTAVFTNGDPACAVLDQTFTITVDPLPCGWSSLPNGVNCNAGSSVAYNPGNQVFTVTSTNCYYPNSFNSDALAFAQHDLCGNGSITAQVTSITGSALGWAGVTMRESNAAGAKKAQLMTNLSELSRREFRTATNGQAYPQQFPSQNRYWLRITRTGNQFVMFISPNGTTWYPAGAQNISMSSCIEMGLVVTNYTANSTVTATFANVSVTGGMMVRPAVGVEEDILALTGFTILPNPSNGLVEVDLRSYSQRKVQLELYNLQGKLLRSTNVETGKVKEEIDLSAFANGMYLIRVRAEGLPDVTKRVVLNSNR